MYGGSVFQPGISSTYGTLRCGIYLINWRYPDSRDQQIREEAIQIKLFR